MDDLAARQALAPLQVRTASYGADADAPEEVRAAYAARQRSQGRILGLGGVVSASSAAVGGTLLVSLFAGLDASLGSACAFAAAASIPGFLVGRRSGRSIAHEEEAQAAAPPRVAPLAREVLDELEHLFSRTRLVLEELELDHSSSELVDLLASTRALLVAGFVELRDLHGTARLPEYAEARTLVASLEDPVRELEESLTEHRLLVAALEDSGAAGAALSDAIEFARARSAATAEHLAQGTQVRRDVRSELEPFSVRLDLGNS
jgi:hypothetical protein